MLIEINEERKIIQILRGIAILLVVFHHVAYEFPITEEIRTLISWVNRIHVVIFFVISGWLFEKGRDKYINNGIKKFVTNKFLQLMVPYFIFSFVFSLLIYLGIRIPSLRDFILGFVDSNIKSFPKMIVDIVLFKDFYFESLWFVYTMFFLMIAMYVMNSRRFLQNKCMCLYFVTAIIMKAFFFDMLKGYVIMNSIISYFCWIMFGRWAYETYKNGIFIRKKYVAASFAVMMIIILRSYFLDIYGVGNCIARSMYIQTEIYVFRICCLVVLLCVACYIKNNSIGAVLSKTGDYSYSVYLLHNPWVVNTLIMFMGKHVPFVCGIPLGVIFTVGICIVVSMCLKKYCTKLHNVLFGMVKV